MLVRNVYSTQQQAVNAHNGEGKVLWCRPFEEKNMGGQWHFIDWVTLPAGTSVGVHKHGGNDEMYFIVEGQGIMAVDGEERCVQTGDVILTKSGSAHGLKNASKADIKLFVVEIGIG